MRTRDPRYIIVTYRRRRNKNGELVSTSRTLTPFTLSEIVSRFPKKDGLLLMQAHVLLSLSPDVPCVELPPCGDATYRVYRAKRTLSANGTPIIAYSASEAEEGDTVPVNG